MSTRVKGFFGRSRKADSPRTGNITPPPERVGSDESLMSTGAFSVGRNSVAQSGAQNYSGSLLNSGAVNLSGALNQSGALSGEWRNNGSRASRPASPLPVRITANGSAPPNGVPNGVVKVSLAGQ